MRIGSLFSGVGGLELGLELAGIGHSVWQVEQNEFCRRVLAARWPHAKRYDDVKNVGAANLEPVDMICGGFPCQDISGAGKGKGLAGERSGLWYQFARIVKEMHPHWVVVENVASGAKRWVDAVTDELEKMDYEVLPLPITANAVGAPHGRARVFLVALSRHAPGSSLGQPIADPHGGWGRLDVPGVVYGPSTQLDRDRLKALGNAVVPQCAEVVGHVIGGRSQNPQVAQVANVLLAEARASGVSSLVGVAGLPACAAWDSKPMQVYRERSRRAIKQLEASPTLPTPSASSYGSSGNGDPHDGRGRYAHAGTPSLDTLARRGLLPTPTVGDARAAGSRRHAGSAAHPGVVHGRAVQGEQHGGRAKGAGRLNPEFVEWMMGFARGWTAA